MKHKKITFAIAVVAGMGISSGYAQQATTASGGDASGSGGTVNYSVGQVAYISNSGSSGNVNQGVQQPYEFFTVGINDNDNISITASAFPNPVQENVNLLVQNQDMKNLSYQLFTADNKLLLAAKMNTELTHVPMQSLSVGTYYLSVLSGKKSVKTFTIIKNH